MMEGFGFVYVAGCCAAQIWSFFNEKKTRHVTREKKTDSGPLCFAIRGKRNRAETPVWDERCRAHRQLDGWAENMKHFVFSSVEVNVRRDVVALLSGIRAYTSTRIHVQKIMMFTCDFRGHRRKIRVFDMERWTLS